MQQTSYNLCPVKTAYSGQCYYDSDITFDRLSGSTTTLIEDAPDGEWDLIMRRDIFMKTRGAVRDYAKLVAVSYYYRVYLAALSAIAEQNTELMLLNQAISVASQDALTYAKTLLQSQNATTADFNYQQLLNALCGCDSIPISDTNSTTWAQSGLLLQALNNTVNGYTDLATFKADKCGSIPGKWQGCACVLHSWGTLVG